MNKSAGNYAALTTFFTQQQKFTTMEQEQSKVYIIMLADNKPQFIEIPAALDEDFLQLFGRYVLVSGKNHLEATKKYIALLEKVSSEL
jgi:hypothetical protein